MAGDSTHYRAGGRARLVLAHGAGAGQRHPFMVAFARGLAERGIDVVTFDFPYMQEKRRAPDKAPVLEARFREVVDAVRGDMPLFIGGKSMGGRMATHLAAQGLGGVRGVVALGYPLHPPGRPGQARDAHLPAIRVPVLIVQGERDTFGTPEEFAPVVARMHADVTVHAVAGGDHSFAVRGRKSADVYPPLLDRIAEWLERRL
jgi:predicted alpha/beta-hydrolase family hydrolase